MNYLNGTKLDNRHIRLQVDKVRSEIHVESFGYFQDACCTHAKFVS